MKKRSVVSMIFVIGVSVGLFFLALKVLVIRGVYLECHRKPAYDSVLEIEDECVKLGIANKGDWCKLPESSFSKIEEHRVGQVIDCLEANKIGVLKFLVRQSPQVQ